MIPQEHGPDTMEFWLEPPLLIALQSDVAEFLEELNKGETMSAVAELRNRLTKAKIPTMSHPLNIYAIDSSYPSPPLELVGGVLTVLSYGYVGYVNGVFDKYINGELILEDSSDFEKSISRRAQVRERELAIRLLVNKQRGKVPLDLLVIDGEIPMHPLPYNLPAEGGVLNHVGRVLDELLAMARRTRTTLVGIVKRVRSRYLSVVLGRCLPMNDKLAMSLALDGGEYYVLGTYGDVLPRWLEINYNDCELRRRCRGECPEVKSRMRERLEEGLKNLEKVLNSTQYPGLSELRNVKIAYYRPRNGASAVKIEVLEGNVGLEDTIAYLESQTTDTGYPFLLDRVDEYVRVDPRMLDYVRTLMIRNSGVNDVVMRMLEFTNPQKSYLFKRMDA